MEILLCIPLVAVIISFLAWIFIRDGIPFSRLPLTEYRLLLESVVFFIPASATGWLSALLAQVILESDGKMLTIFWLIGMLVAFIIMGFFELAIGVKEAPKDMGSHDLIAVGIGYLAGLMFGGYQVMVRHTRPPQYLYYFWNNSIWVILFICVGSIALISLFAILQQYIRPRRRKSKTSKGTTRRTKKSPAAEMDSNSEILLSGTNQVDVDAEPSRSAPLKPEINQPPLDD